MRAVEQKRDAHQIGSYPARWGVADRASSWVIPPRAAVFHTNKRKTASTLAPIMTRTNGSQLRGPVRLGEAFGVAGRS